MESSLHDRTPAQANLAQRKYIPTWDGNPAGWQRYLEELLLWLASEDLDVKYCIAARVIHDLTGSARRCALRIPLRLLKPRRRPQQSAAVQAAATLVPDTDGDALMPMQGPVRTETSDAGAASDDILNSDLAAGVKYLVEELRRSLQASRGVRKGQTMTEFFRDPKFHRQLGERVSDYIARFDETLALLKDSGFDAESVPDLAGWAFIHMMRLNEERDERLISKVPDDEFPLAELKRHALSIFGSLHVHEQVLLAQQSQQSSQADARRRDFRGRFHGSAFGRGAAASQVQVDRPSNLSQPAAVRETMKLEHADGFEDFDDDDGPVDAADFQGVCRVELESLLIDVDQHGEVVDPIRAARLEDAANTLAIASDALCAVREAREALKAKGGAASSSLSASPPPARTWGDEQPAVDLRPPRGSGAQVVRYGKKSLRASIMAKKSKTLCRVCGRMGHWAGDPECPDEGPG
ncbi:unnamed protein product [Polarella glacialis]|uniref:Uncharacterized protein n=1 Tax=Polarella glacialis TaxID=89957 RepID=A0A813DWN6_POLGL|nr:unnamed protein product [Polarella glacialis]CAE8642293.1 unnamed protein product [Polarella glacialis]CAE8650446.1 unnamed protein product [Polarella glacialis]